MKFRMLSSLLLATMIVLNCQSSENQIRETRDSVCSDIQIPDAARVRPGQRLENSHYNALVDHCADLARCLRYEQCVRKITEWERDCQTERVRALEDQWLPGAFTPRFKCGIPKPLCGLEED
jgi:hypothetical protein